MPLPFAGLQGVESSLRVADQSLHRVYRVTGWRVFLGFASSTGARSCLSPVLEVGAAVFVTGSFRLACLEGCFTLVYLAKLVPLHLSGPPGEASGQDDTARGDWRLSAHSSLVMTADTGDDY
jgi:hypothetical protein